MKGSAFSGSVLVLAVGAASTACASSAGGPDLRRAEVSVIDSEGSRTPAHCVTLPVLFGSHTQDDVDVDGEFGLVLFTSNKMLDIVLDGATFEFGSTHSVTIDELDQGYHKEFSVESASGARFTLLVDAGCRS